MLSPRLARNALGFLLIATLWLGFQMASAAWSGDGPEQIRPPASSLPSSGEFAPGEVLVKFKSDAPSASVQVTLSAQDARVVGEVPALGVQRLTVPKGQELAIIASLGRHPLVEYAEPNYIIRAVLTPNDPYFSSQWGLTKIGAPQAWDVTTGSSDLIIAIVDSGIDLDHPDLNGKIILGYDYVNGDWDPDDDYGHGTHVAGIAAAKTNNSTGIAGVSWGARLMALKVLDAGGNGTYADVASAVTYAADNGAKIINLSLGGDSDSQTLHDAVVYAHSAGCVLAAATGNDGGSAVLYPAKYAEALAVAATDSNDQRAGFSNYGPEVDIAAPGVDIYSTYLGGYISRSGTSMATPHVAGLAALIWSEYPSYTNDQVKGRIEMTALDLGASGRDQYYGHGRIDAQAALCTPDLVTSVPSPDNGASSPPFCVGQEVDWYTTVTNQGGGEADSTDVGYYIATSSSDFYNRVNSDSTGTLAPNGGSSTEHNTYIFTAADVGTRYANVWADYPNDLEEENESNNRNSYGPFQVIGIPSAPSLSSPSNGSSTCDTTPYFDWSSVSGATSYRIQVDSNSSFSSPEINQTTSGTSYTPGTGLAPGTYYWRVQASNACGTGSWSSTWSFTILSTPSSAPSLSSPSNGSSTCNTTPTFSWGSLSGATSYRIQVDNNSSFSSPEINQTTSGTSYTPGTGLAAGTYYWRVRAINVCGEGSWSSTWGFTILSMLSAPSLSSPLNGSTISDDTPTFSWSSVSGATSYRIQVDSNSSFSSPEINQTTSGTSYTPGMALALGIYYWRVRAINACGEGSWSSTLSFTINNLPNPPSNPSPADGATGVSINADLSWIGGDPDPGDTVTYDVYFEANDPPDNLICNDVSAPACDPGTLAYGTHYYWYVVAADNHNASTTGATWGFTTGEPDITVHPPQLVVSMTLNCTVTRTLTISNGGNVDLTWSLAEDLPEDWLSEAPTSGTVAPSDRTDVAVVFDCSGLGEGDYNTDLVISSNDPDENPVIVPVFVEFRAPENTYLPIILKNHP